MWEGNVDLEDWRDRTETVNWGSASRAARTEGPMLPPAYMPVQYIGLSLYEGGGFRTPMIMTFLME